MEIRQGSFRLKSIGESTRSVMGLTSEKIASAVVQIDRSVKGIEADATEGRVFPEKVRLSADSGVCAVNESIEGIKRIEKGSNIIARNIQCADELIRFLIKSVNEQNEKSRVILNDIERVKTISEISEEKAKDINEVIKVLSAESELLEQEVRRFKI